MTTMVEKIAQAILDAIMEGGAFVNTNDDDLRCLVLVDGDVDVLAVARAAIVAMMEPSKEMVSAGYEKINENIDFWNYESNAGYAVEDIAPTATWRAMIQAALKEGQE